MKGLLETEGVTRKANSHSGMALRVTPTAELDATFCAVNGRTRLSELFTKAPLKIAQTFPLENALGVCLMDFSPGLLAGDFYNFRWHLQENTRVHISTQGFTRVHPSRERPCLLRQNIHIENGAVMEYFPEPLMLYKDSALRAESEISIARGGALLYSEIVCAGRIGRGEEFQFSSLENRLRVRYDNELIFMNQTSLCPQIFKAQRIGAWQDFTHQGNFYIFAEQVKSVLLDELRLVLDQAATSEKSSPVLGGASLLDKNGIAISLLGNRACDLQDIMQRLRERARCFLLST